MFKISSAVLLMTLLLNQGCRTVPPFPAADLTEPGWTLYQGQALWSPPRSSTSVAGELLVALHPDGHGLAQFTKNPFPLITARIRPGAWELQTAEGQRFSAPGKPPNRIVWFQLLHALAGNKIPPNWRWEIARENEYRLFSRERRETLEVYLAP